ncbi:MAG: bifunctional NADP-dependent methylenetetrahydromethanopterin dehydrogenase/methylenetetrahydrofolate dehydrogenase [Planctomycetes bacterium]|nr:bifunctional NADP-dependent methylenetetrahydromethanopterin dehydrogenase/methylenetetrahydrofolate dehydrogenase [Planctomycetota bacterium]
MTKQRILIQFDTDPQASVFDAVVAIDAGVDHLLQYSNVKPEQVRDLVHGAMYTRGPQDLRSTAIFVGGSNVAHGEQIFSIAQETMFDPFRVSVMLDCNGSNSTAAAAVLSASRHVTLEGSTALVLAATGPVGQRICRILANEKCKVYVSSRSMERSQETVDRLRELGVDTSRLVPISTSDEAWVAKSLAESEMVFACGAAGVRLLHGEQLAAASKLKVAIDLNAVPPLGIDGIGLTDKGVERNGRTDYGALGVGGLKMKIHKASVAALFENNGKRLDCQEMLGVGRDILAKEMP